MPRKVARGATNFVGWALAHPTKADPGLRQVYANLIGNALKFSGDEPAPRIEVGATAEQGEPVPFVRDNGGWL